MVRWTAQNNKVKKKKQMVCCDTKISSKRRCSA